MVLRSGSAGWRSVCRPRRAGLCLGGLPVTSVPRSSRSAAWCGSGWARCPRSELRWSCSSVRVGLVRSTVPAGHAACYLRRTARQPPSPGVPGVRETEVMVWDVCRQCLVGVRTRSELFDPTRVVRRCLVGCARIAVLAVSARSAAASVAIRHPIALPTARDRASSHPSLPLGAWDEEASLDRVEQVLPRVEALRYQPKPGRSCAPDDAV